MERGLRGEGRLTGCRNMQNCFRKYPEVYGSEMDGEDADEDVEEGVAHVATENARSERAIPEHASTKERATPEHAQSESIPAPAYSDSTPAPSSKPAEDKPAHESSQSQDKSIKSQDRPAPKTDAAPADKAKQSPERTSQAPSRSERPNLGLVPEDYKPKDEEPTSESEKLVPKGAHDDGEEGTEKLERK